jgi:phage terminase large subunit-like protein
MWLAVMVRHVSGGVSRVDLLSYEMDHHKFQGFKWDLAWLDEEPAKNPLKIFTEIMTRLVSRKGLMMFTRTPLFGLTPIVKHYLYPTSNQTWHTGASMDDAPHLDEEAKSMLLDSLPLHERETRRTGKILLGSGNIYPVTEDMLSQAPFEVPRFFRKVVGIDFGANHPFACVKIAYDADNDCVYVVDAKKVTAREAKESSAQDMLAAVHSRMVDQMCLGVKLPVSWPHDGMNREKGTGIQLIESYRECGLNCLPFSARYKNEKGGPQSREPIIQE